MTETAALPQTSLQTLSERTGIGLVPRATPPNARRKEWTSVSGKSRGWRATFWRWLAVHYTHLLAVLGGLLQRVRRPRTDSVALESAVAGLCATVESLRLQVRELEERGRLSAPPAPAPCLNLANRGMALKLARQGQQPGQIARLLGIPLGEVVLLLKMQKRQGVRTGNGAEESR